LRHAPRASLVLLVGLLIAVAGCGTSAEEEVADTIKTFYRAAAAGDGERACEQLTPAARATAGGVPCEAAVDQLETLGGATAKRRLAAITVRHVRVRGDRATAEAEIPTQNPTTFHLTQVRRRLFRWKEPVREWKIDSAAMPAGGAL
jgi:hypothetical protein